MPSRRAILPALVLLVAGCHHSDRVGQREVFHWTAQPISFAPPANGWRREGELSGGVKGVRFVKEGSVGEAITIGELHDVAERDRSAAIRELLDSVDTLDRREFLHRISLARCRTDAPYSEAEASVAANVNSALDRASSAYLNGDHTSAHAELETALAEAEKLKFSLDDVAALESHSGERRSTRVANEPAVSIEWTSERNGHHYVNRDLYFVHRNHLFVARFIGLTRSVSLFERVVDSIEFPQ